MYTAEEITDFLIACSEIANAGGKYRAGIIAARRLLKRHRKEDILAAAFSIKRRLEYDFIRGIKRGLNLYA